MPGSGQVRIVTTASDAVGEFGKIESILRIMFTPDMFPRVPVLIKQD
jgi:hypothetical protein